MNSSSPRRTIAYLTSGGRAADGIVKTVLNLATHLDRNRFDPHVITVKPCALLEETLPKAGIPLHHPDPAKPFSSLVDLMEDCDLIHVQDSPVNLLVYFAARAACPRIVESLQTTQLGKAFFPDLHSVCVSNDILDLQPDPDRCRVIYNAAPIPAEPLERSLTDRVQLIQIGRPEKFLFSLADILPRLHAPNVEGLILGHVVSGPPNLRCVEFTPDVNGALRESDFLVHFPWEEGLGLVVIEAMAQGTVPMATGVGGILEIIEEGKNGFFLRQDSLDEAVRCVDAALEMRRSDPDRFQKMRRQARERATERFGIAEAVQKHSELYLEVLASPPVRCDPVLYETAFASAMDDHFSGRHAPAAETLKELDTSFECFATSLFQGVAAAAVGDSVTARKALTKAHGFFPTSLFVANARAALAKQSNDLAQYMQMIEHSLTRSPYQLDLYAEVSEELIRRGKWEDAQDYLNRLKTIIEWRFPFAARRLRGLLSDFESKRRAVSPPKF
ncbi:MAG: glycosyltransferase family 4 protein [Nitrospirae bacterium]|nr:glycosyltransferase family 4 protein [Nitrospirota bacterium]